MIGRMVSDKITVVLEDDGSVSSSAGEMMDKVLSDHLSDLMRESSPADGSVAAIFLHILARSFRGQVQMEETEPSDEEVII